MYLPERHALIQRQRCIWIIHTSWLCRGLDSSKTGTPCKTARWSTRVVVSAAVSIPRILLVCITFSILSHLLSYRPRGHGRLFFGSSVALFLIIVTQDVLLHWSCGTTFDSCERTLETSLFETSSALCTSGPSTWNWTTDGCINDL